MAIRIYKDIIEFGRVILPWLGVYATTINKPLASLYDLGVSRGALIVKVVPYSPAYRAGLRPGDIIIRINNSEIGSAEELSGAIRMRRIGEVIQVEYVRGRSRKTVEVELEPPPTVF